MAHACCNTSVFKGKAPGSLILMGEHAVLHQKHAVVLAMNQFITVHLTARSDNKINIMSALGQLQIPFTAIQPIAPFEYVLTTIQYCYENINPLTHGLDIHIESEFSDKLGFGSSAAVVVACLTAFKKLSQISEDKQSLFNQALSIVKWVQGHASGADVAASVYGGMILYRAEPQKIVSLPILTEKIVYAVYSGYKTKTADVLQKVQEQFQAKPSTLKWIMEGIEHCTQQALVFLEKKDWNGLGICMNIAQGYLNALGVSDKQLELLINQLRNTMGILGAKISGAGLGDCVIGLGDGALSALAQTQLQMHPIVISEQGCV